VIVVVADTSGLLAALDDSHPQRAAAKAALDEAGALIVSPLLLAELDHVGARVLGTAATWDAIDDLARWAKAGRVLFPEITPAVLDAAQSLRRRYSGLRLDLADAVNVVVAAQFRTNAVLTLDFRDYRAITPLSAHEAFVILPVDG
jgi:predicted nucleic acid-binding protein